MMNILTNLPSHENKVCLFEVTVVEIIRVESLCKLIIERKELPLEENVLKVTTMTTDITRAIHVYGENMDSNTSIHPQHYIYVSKCSRAGSGILSKLPLRQISAAKLFALHLQF